VNDESAGMFKPCFVLVTALAVMVLPANPGFALNIYEVLISVTEYRTDGVPDDTPYEFSARTGGWDITQVGMTTPGGTVYSLEARDQFNWGLSIEDYATLADLRAAFPTGSYTFTFNGGTDSVTLSHNPTRPTGFANITYPVHDSNDVPLDPTLTWDDCTGHGSALTMALADEETGMVALEMLADIALTAWAPVTLEPGREHSLEVAVFAGTAGQPYASQTVGSDDFGYYDLFENCNEVSFTTVSPADIDWISITSCKSHLDGIPRTFPWQFEIWVYVADPGSLHHIDVTKPGDSVPFATMYEEGPTPRWGDYDSPASYSSIADLRTVYPNGVYTFEFYDISNNVLRTVSLDYSGLVTPMNPVSFTYPAVDGATVIDTSPTLTWNVGSGDGDALMILLEDSTADVVWDAPVSITTTSLAPSPLLGDHTYGFEVSVITVKDLQNGPAFPTMSVDGDQFRYSLMIEHLNEVSFTTATPTLIGDFCGASFTDPDGYVDVWDLMEFADNWHTRTGEGNWDSKYDLTGSNFSDPDGYVDVWDLMVFADHWHEGQRP